MQAEGEFCVACGSRTLVLAEAPYSELHPSETRLIHFRGMPFGPAICGASGNISCHNSWQEVTCQSCLTNRESAEKKARNSITAKKGCAAVVIGVILLVAVCSVVVVVTGDTEADCPYSIADFGRIPRQTAEAASGLYGVDAKSQALADNTEAWKTYERAYNDKAAAMRRECD